MDKNMISMAIVMGAVALGVTITIVLASKKSKEEEPAGDTSALAKSSYEMEKPNVNFGFFEPLGYNRF